MTPDLLQFADAVQDALKRSTGFKGKPWKTSDKAWGALNAGFSHTQFIDDESRNRAMKHHLAERWLTADQAQKRHFATWIIRDWGGIKRNSDATIARHLALVEEPDPVTPFAGVASFSKVLSIRDPAKFAIFDARVAYSLNAIQVARTRGERNLGRFSIFPCPPGQNREISGEGRKPGYMDLLGKKALLGRGLAFVEKKDAYQTYLNLLQLLSQRSQISVLSLEMDLFGKVIHFCEEARNSLSGEPQAVRK